MADELQFSTIAQTAELVRTRKLYWEEDLPAHEEVCRAMDEAIDVFGKLGATVEACRTRPMRESMDFLGRVLPACLFQAAHYVAASREHRRIIKEARALYAQYDVLLTAGFGPAPRLDEHRTVSFWHRPSIFTPSNVTAGPALEICNGFSESGLPFGMQIIGRPFDEATVLKVGHAYEQATAWRARRPRLTSGARQPAVTPEGNEQDASSVNAATRALALELAARAGLELNDREQTILLESAPHAPGSPR
jgi:aspartyl-tRNA(Asn)/glutamyl-tRNA(Gln) amidotransferase subunit A